MYMYLHNSSLLPVSTPSPPPLLPPFPPSFISLSFFPQLIASEQKNVDFLLSLCDFAILRDFPLLRDSVRNLLKLLPTGQMCMYMYTCTVYKQCTCIAFQGNIYNVGTCTYMYMYIVYTVMYIIIYMYLNYSSLPSLPSLLFLTPSLPHSLTSSLSLHTPLLYLHSTVSFVY